MAETGPVITDMEHSEYLKPVWLLLGPSGSTTRPARAADRNRAFRACKAFTLQLWIGTIPEERVRAAYQGLSSQDLGNYFGRVIYHMGFRESAPSQYSELALLGSKRVQYGTTPDNWPPNEAPQHHSTKFGEGVVVHLACSASPVFKGRED